MAGPGLLHLTTFLAQTELAELIRRLNVGGKQRMGKKRFRLEFRMKLTGNEPGMIGPFNGFHQIKFRISSADLHPAFFQHRNEMIHHLITVTMAF